MATYADRQAWHPLQAGHACSLTAGTTATDYEGLLPAFIPPVFALSALAYPTFAYPAFMGGLPGVYLQMAPAFLDAEGQSVFGQPSESSNSNSTILRLGDPLGQQLQQLQPALVYRGDSSSRTSLESCSRGGAPAQDTDEVTREVGAAPVAASAPPLGTSVAVTATVPALGTLLEQRCAENSLCCSEVTLVSGASAANAGARRHNESLAPAPQVPPLCRSTSPYDLAAGGAAGHAADVPPPQRVAKWTAAVASDSMNLSAMPPAARLTAASLWSSPAVTMLQPLIMAEASNAAAAACPGPLPDAMQLCADPGNAGADGAQGRRCGVGRPEPATGLAPAVSGTSTGSHTLLRGLSGRLVWVSSKRYRAILRRRRQRQLHTGGVTSNALAEPRHPSLKLSPTLAVSAQLHSSGTATSTRGCHSGWAANSSILYGGEEDRRRCASTPAALDPAGRPPVPRPVSTSVHPAVHPGPGGADVVDPEHTDWVMLSPVVFPEAAAWCSGLGGGGGPSGAGDMGGGALSSAAAATAAAYRAALEAELQAVLAEETGVLPLDSSEDEEEDSASGQDR